MSTWIQENSFSDMGIYESARENMRPSGDLISLAIQQSDETLVRSIKQRMESVSMSRCIFRIGNQKNQDSNYPAFVPKLVSIGPYHHANESLKVVEEHKWKYSFALLTRKPNLEARLDKCIKGLRELEHRASMYYADKLNLTSEEFVEIMLIDGCFIIELLIRYGLKSLRRRDDPFFGHKGRISALRLDMVMLENQIPFFVLQMLFSLAPMPEQCTQSLNELAFRFFRHIIPGGNSSFMDKFGEHGYHFLDMIHRHLLPMSLKMETKVVTAGSSSKMISSATNLKQTGFILKENTKHPSALLDIIIFTKRRILTIPQLKIQQHTEALLRNLIEYEQCRSHVVDSTPFITSYVFLMHNLICSEKDAELLEKKGIVKNYVADSKATADMFKRVSNGIELEQNVYAELCEQVNKYKKKKWTQWGSIFKDKGKVPLA